MRGAWQQTGAARARRRYGHEEHFWKLVCWFVQNFAGAWQQTGAAMVAAAMLPRPPRLPPPGQARRPARGARGQDDVLACPFCHGTGERTTCVSHDREPLVGGWVGGWVGG